MWIYFKFGSQKYVFTAQKVISHFNVALLNSFD